MSALKLLHVVSVCVDEEIRRSQLFDSVKALDSSLEFGLKDFLTAVNGNLFDIVERIALKRGCGYWSGVS